MSTHDKPLHHLDLLMWNVNDPVGLTNITAMMFFKSKLDFERVINVVNKRIEPLEKFKQKIINKNGRPNWHDDELFDIHSHIHKVALPDKGDDEALMVMVSDLISSPLDYTKPLWQIHFIENYKGGTALLWRIHHAIGDGASLSRALLLLTDEPEDKIVVENSEDKKRMNWRDKLKQAIHLTEQTFSEVKKVVTDPEQRKEVTEVVKNTIKDLESFVTTGSNDNSIYKGELGVQKKVSWSKVMSLPEIKTISKHYGVKVNDTLLGAITGALRKHMEAHGQDTGIKFNIVCPVDMRHNEKKLHLDNRVGVIILDLPIEIVDMGERLKDITNKTNRLKHSLEPSLTYLYTQFLTDFIPKRFELYSAKKLGSKLMAILSNVPGPREAILFADHEVDNIMFWLPHTYDMGLALSVISYNDKVTCGITVDAHLVKDPDSIIRYFEEEIDHTILSIKGFDE